MTDRCLTRGDPAPDFSFKDASGARRSLHAEAQGTPLFVYFHAAGEAADSADEIASLVEAAPAIARAPCKLFVVLRNLNDAASISSWLESPTHVVADVEGGIARSYGIDREAAGFLIDPRQRVLGTFVRDGSPIIERGLAALNDLPLPEYYEAPVHAPILLIPDVLEPDLCRSLIDRFDSDGGEEGGTWRLENGKLVNTASHETKRRLDLAVTEPDLQRQITAVLGRRILPEIERAYHVKITKMEELKIVRYDPTVGGYFRPHRDNTLDATAHRRFAMTLNLNSEDYDGGELAFPEFDGATYKPATGEAAVFSCSLMHEAKDVARGPRYVLLAFFYDDLGARIRADFQRRVASAAGED